MNNEPTVSADIRNTLEWLWLEACKCTDGHADECTAFQKMKKVEGYITWLANKAEDNERSCESAVKKWNELEAENTRLRADCCVMLRAIELNEQQFHNTKTIVSALVANGSEIDGTAIMMDCENALRRNKKLLSQVAHYPKP